MALRVTVLGCTGGYPGAGEACSGYLVEGGGVRIALDLGPGSLANLQRHVPLEALDAVVLSHEHPDHWVDFTVLNTAFTYQLARTDVPVFGTAETRTMADVVVGPLAPTWAWNDVADGDAVTVGGLTLSFSRTDHYVHTLAVRVADGERSLAYSADTGPGWSFAAFGEPVDLAVCESTMLESEEPDGILHLSARQAATMCQAAGVGRLVLTHFSTGADPEQHRAAAAAAGFTGPVEVAAVHATFEA